MKIKFSRFPWQRRPRHWSTPSDAPANWSWGKCGGMGRFGGGWEVKGGIALSGKILIVDVLIGSVRISWGKDS